MADLDDLARAISASIRSVDFSLNTAQDVQPKSHRGDMARSQLEAAREILVKARDFCEGRSSGLYPAVGPTQPPKKP